MSVTVPVCPPEAVVTGNDRHAAPVTGDASTRFSSMAAFSPPMLLLLQAFMTPARLRDRDALLSHDRWPEVRAPLSQPNATGTLFPGAGLRMMVHDIDGTARSARSVSPQVSSDKDV